MPSKQKKTSKSAPKKKAPKISPTAKLKAEFDNYRRRKQEETSNLLKYDGEAVIKQFLSVLDDLGRLESASAENGESNKETLHEGIELIINKINNKKF